MPIDRIVSLFSNKYGYITNIDDVISFLHKCNCNDSEIADLLFQVHKYNYDRLQLLSDKKKKEEDYNKTNELISRIITPDKREPITTKKSNTKINDSYYKRIVNFIRDEEYGFIELLLPNYGDKDFEEAYISTLICINQEIKTINDMLKEMDDVEYIEDELRKLYRARQEIINYHTDETQIDEEDTEELDELPENKNLIFLTKSDGTYYIDDDMKEIDNENLVHINSLLHSILRDEMTHVKRLREVSLIDRLCEYKRRNGRVVFRQLDENSIVVLAVFIKDCQNDKDYRAYLKRRAKYYSENEEYYKELASNKEARAIHREITTNLLKTVNERMKGYVKND